MAVTCFTLLTLTLISTFVTFMPVVQGCFCAPEHPQVTYCKADFAIKAEVIAWAEVFDDEDGSGDGEPIAYSRYEVDLREAYKVHPEMELDPVTYVYAAPRISSCFVDLEPGVDYILLGHMVEGKAFLYPCSGAQAWAELTSRMMRGYRFLYEQHCNCTVRTTFRPHTEPNPEASDFNCLWYIRHDREFCFAKHGLCKKRDVGCKWSRTDNLRDCLGIEPSSPEDDGGDDGHPNDIPLPTLEPLKPLPPLEPIEP